MVRSCVAYADRASEGASANAMAIATTAMSMFLNILLALLMSLPSRVTPIWPRASALPTRRSRLGRVTSQRRLPTSHHAPVFVDAGAHRSRRGRGLPLEERHSPDAAARVPRRLHIHASCTHEYVRVHEVYIH